MRIHHITESEETYLRDWMEDNGWSYDAKGWLVHPTLHQRLSPKGERFMGDVKLTLPRMTDQDFLSLHEIEILERYTRDFPGLLRYASGALQLAAVRQNGHAIRYIRNPSEAVQLAAVRKNGHAIDYISNPSEAVKLAAVRQNGHAIKYIKSPSEEVQLAARQNGWTG